MTDEAWVPTKRAALECAHRMVCGRRGDVFVDDEGTIYSGAAFKLEPSRDTTDALIVVLAKAIEFHLTDVDFSQLRDQFVATDVGDVFANQVYDQLCALSDDEWLVIHERVAFYERDNARIAALTTAKSGESS